MTSPYHELTEAFKIFLKYPHRGYVSAEHDTLYAGPNPAIVSEEDKETLKSFGWYEDLSVDAFLKYL